MLTPAAWAASAALHLLAAAAQPAPMIEDLAWLAGDRTHATATRDVREVWIGPGSGVLLGMSLTTRRDGKPGEYEHMKIGPMEDGRLAFFALPSGQPPAVFPLKSLENRRAVFENLQHDFPQRVIYWDKGSGAVGARIEGVIDGKERSAEWSYEPRR